DRQDARDDVGRPARRERHDHGYGSVRVGRLRGRTQARQDASAGGGQGAPPDVSSSVTNHAVLPVAPEPILIRQRSRYFPSISLLARERTSAGALMVASAIFCASSPVIGLMSVFDFSASARKSGSFITASKARRSASTRSVGTPALVTSGREIAVSAEMNVSTCRSASFLARSWSVGTSGSSGLRFTPTWTSTMTFFSASHCGRVDFHDAHEFEPRPPTSPRSIARLISLPPG